MQQIGAKFRVSADWWGKVASCQCLLRSAGRTPLVSQFILKCNHRQCTGSEMDTEGSGLLDVISWGLEQLQDAFTEFRTQDLCRCFKTSHDRLTSCIKSQMNYFEGTSLQQGINSVATIRNKYCPGIISPRYIGTAFCNTLRGYGPVTRQTVQQTNHIFWSCVLYISACHQLL